jgi:hypothetical protein
LIPLTLGEVFLAKGGFYVDGRVFESIDEEEIMSIGAKLKAVQCSNVVVSGLNECLYL